MERVVCVPETAPLPIMLRDPSIAHLAVAHWFALQRIGEISAPFSEDIKEAANDFARRKIILQVDNFVKQTKAEGDDKIIESAFRETEKEGADLSPLRTDLKAVSVSALSQENLAMLYVVLVVRYGMPSCSEATV
jgi:hypothetical protein